MIVKKTKLKDITRMSDLPLVSIGMPVFNEEKTISRALDSLLLQTFPNFEVIISDNYRINRITPLAFLNF